jgi:hypothetical protein
MFGLAIRGIGQRAILRALDHTREQASGEHQFSRAARCDICAVMRERKTFSARLPEN